MGQCRPQECKLIPRQSESRFSQNGMDRVAAGERKGWGGIDKEHGKGELWVKTGERQGERSGGC